MACFTASLPTNANPNVHISFFRAGANRRRGKGREGGGGKLTVNHIMFQIQNIITLRTPPSKTISRVQLTPQATRRTPHGALRLVQAMSAWSVKTQRAPSRPCRDAKVNGHTTTAMTTAMNEMSTPLPPAPPLTPKHASLITPGSCARRQARQPPRPPPPARRRPWKRECRYRGGTSGPAAEGLPQFSRACQKKCTGETRVKGRPSRFTMTGRSVGRQVGIG